MMSKLDAKGDDMADDARNVAVLIDFENLSDAKSLRKALARGCELGRVVAKLAVGDFSANGDKAQAKLRELGILPVQQASAGKGKNTSDMRLAIEAVNLFHDPRQSIDVFVFATSDVDFLPLAQWLRSAGKHVIGAGRSDASALWQKGVDEYLVVKVVKTAKETSKPAKKTRAKTQTSVKSKSAQSAKAPKPASTGTAVKSNVLNPAYKGVIETAINDVFSNGVTEVKSRTLLRRIVKLDQKFSCKKAGFNSFRKLVGSFDQVSIPANPKTGEFVIHKRDAVKSRG